MFSVQIPYVELLERQEENKMKWIDNDEDEEESEEEDEEEGYVYA